MPHLRASAALLALHIYLLSLLVTGCDRTEYATGPTIPTAEQIALVRDAGLHFDVTRVVEPLTP